MQEKLQNLYVFSNGINTAKENYGTGRKMISVMDILSKEHLYYDNIINSVTVSHNIEQKNKVEEDDLVFVRSSETRDEVGWAKAYKDNKYSVFSGFVIRGTSISNNNSYFIESSLNHKNRKQIETVAEGSTRYNIGQKSLQNIALLLPALKEQYKITKLLESLNNIITLEQEKLEAVLETKHAMLRRVFSTKTSDTMVSFKLSNFISKKGKVNKENKKYTVSSVNNKKGFINQNEQFESTRLNSLDKSTYRIVNPKDFAYNPSRINVGSIGYNDTNDTLIISPLYIVFRINDEIDNRYFYYYTQTEKFLYEVNRNTEGSVRQSLSFENMGNINIPLPKSYKTQLLICQYFNKMENIANNIEQKINSCKNIKAYLLRNLFV